MKVKFLEALQPQQFGIALVALCVTLSTCQSQSQNPQDSQNNSTKVSDHETTRVFYVRKGDTAKLPCEISLPDANRTSIVPKWTKLPKDNNVDMTKKCREEKTEDNEFKCSIIFKDESPRSKDKTKIFTSTLRIQEVDEKDYGTYECSLSSRSTNVEDDKQDQLIKKVELREAVTATRRSLTKDRKERSVLVEVNTPFLVYCNYTGLMDDHKVEWIFENKSITKDLENGSGLFENFTSVGEYAYEGQAIYEHRGGYTCSVELRNASDGVNHSTKFPVQYTFYVRVREGNRWILPTCILAGEIVLLAAMTALWWRKVDGVEGGVDGNFADSDDEDATK